MFNLLEHTFINQKERPHKMSDENLDEQQKAYKVFFVEALEAYKTLKAVHEKIFCIVPDLKDFHKETMEKLNETIKFYESKVK